MKRLLLVLALAACDATIDVQAPSVAKHPASGASAAPSAPSGSQADRLASLVASTSIATRIANQAQSDMSVIRSANLSFENTAQQQDTFCHQHNNPNCTNYGSVRNAEMRKAIKQAGPEVTTDLQAQATARGDGDDAFKAFVSLAVSAEVASQSAANAGVEYPLK